METIFHVLFAPKWAYWDADRLLAINPVKVTKKRPTGAGVVIKFRVSIPNAAFEPLKIEAVVDVGLEQTVTNVTVLEPEPA